MLARTKEERDAGGRGGERPQAQRDTQAGPAAMIGRTTTQRRKPRVTTGKPRYTYDNLSHSY
jgi:hypothetical protein